VSRARNAMVYDQARSRSVMFGGRSGGGVPMADTWLWDGATGWTQATPATSPSPRYAAAMAYDPVGQQPVLFGGWTYSGVLNDMWVWNGTDWLQQSTSTAPLPRMDHAMASDTGRRRVVVFGGLQLGAKTLGDTWEWDGRTWQQRQPGQSPHARFGHRMTYDAARRRVVLFGGDTPAIGAETWEWDGTTWTQRFPGQSPPPRWYHSMGYDPVAQRVVVFGGQPAGLTNSVLGDTWEWDGATWTQRALGGGPAARATAPMVFDMRWRRLSMYGGQSRIASLNLTDAWVYGVAPASAGYGAGCGSTAGIPSLVPMSDASIGNSSFALGVDSAPPSAAAALLVSAAPLNAPLGNGCSLLVDLAAASASVASSTNLYGHVAFALPVPLAPELRGRQLFAQGVVADAGAPWSGIAFSAGLAFTIGN